MFTISFDQDARLISVLRTGFPSLAEVEEYERQITELVAKIAPNKKPFDVMLDSTRGGVLAKGVLEPLARVSSMLAAQGVRRVAVVNPSAIKAMQTKRVTSPTLDLQVFPSIAEAQAWLRRGQINRPGAR